MICPKCKKYVALKLQKCPYCGHTLEAHTNPQDASNNVNPQGVSHTQHARNNVRPQGVSHTQHARNNVNPRGVSHTQHEIYDKDKSWFGVLMAIIFGRIGLIVGICMYPVGTESRRTFMRGYIKAFIIQVLLAIILAVSIVCYASSIINKL